MGPLNMGFLCGYTGHMPRKLTWCLPLYKETLKIWAVSEFFFFLRVNLKTLSLRTGSFCVKSDFPTFPGSELRPTHSHDESEIVIFILSEAIRSGCLKGISLVKHGELKYDFICFFS